MDLRGNWASACPALLQCPRRNQVAPGIRVLLLAPIVPLQMGPWEALFNLQDQPLRTSLPIMVPDSSFSCALRRLAALMGPWEALFNLQDQPLRTSLPIM